MLHFKNQDMYFLINFMTFSTPKNVKCNSILFDRKIVILLEFVWNVVMKVISKIGNYKYITNLQRYVIMTSGPANSLILVILIYFGSYELTQDISTVY